MTYTCTTNTKGDGETSLGQVGVGGGEHVDKCRGGNADRQGGAYTDAGEIEGGDDDGDEGWAGLG